MSWFFDYICIEQTNNQMENKSQKVLFRAKMDYWFYKVISKDRVLTVFDSEFNPLIEIRSTSELALDKGSREISEEDFMDALNRNTVRISELGEIDE